ncbi:MAG TPA: sulfite reductase subunit alpha [Lacunisphaera sp.]|nr:sulfite reductase subunit alpha [Lacunisphaera sp.]
MPALVPVIPESAPFTPEQRAWLNGYLAGLCARAPAPSAPAPAATPAALMPLTILFGSQTGTAEGLAKRAAKAAGQRGFAAAVIDAASYTTARLGQEKNLLLITSTFGEGEPPDNAKALHAALAASDAPALKALRYSVCGLGDTNYVQFCRCAQDFDARLEKLGARRVSPRVDCDLDYEAPFTRWLDAALAALASAAPDSASAPLPAAVPILAITPESSPAEPVGYGRSRPFPATLLVSRNLNGAGSSKQVHHVEFSLEGSGLVYEAGDALGVMPQNCPQQVAELLAALDCDGEEAVPAPDGGTLPLRRALTECYDLGRPTPELVAALNPAAVSAGAPAASPSAAAFHVIDAVLAAGARPAPADFVRRLRRLQPRLYSIASAPFAQADRVHLTVGAVRYEKDGRPRQGVCSTFLTERAQPGQSIVGVFVHRNPAFRPPADGATPMIMVGPGTGIAPFRAFLQHRAASSARGRNWLFFGDQRAATDFLYRDELAAWQRDGLLTRLDTAFSRDQSEKIYVQQRMLEQADELHAWLEAGAHFYVCGDASRMAKDVEAALRDVIVKAGAKTQAEAEAYVQRLRETKRYARDVY